MTANDACKKPEIGMPVLWYPGGDRTQQPLPALVTRVNPFTVCLHVMSSELKNFMIKDGVRHLDDAGARAPEREEMGAWGHAPWLARLLAVEAELATPPVTTGKK